MTTGEVIVLTAVNILAWLVIHLSLPWIFTRMPAAWFRPGGWLFRPRRWEGEGGIYRRLFLVQRWKNLLPDGAALFKGGFRKKSLRRRDPGYLERFRLETCRGEAVHWAVLAASGLFFIWNPPWAGWVMVAYGTAANLPCIIVQRYNRLRLERIIPRRDKMTR
jgi:glycosyl-4,4'-diaponeurosporenoate acyltransferase